MQIDYSLAARNDKKPTNKLLHVSYEQRSRPSTREAFRIIDLSSGSTKSAKCITLKRNPQFCKVNGTRISGLVVMCMPSYQGAPALVMTLLN